MPHKLSLERCQQFALEKNDECLSYEYSNSWTKLLWRCSAEHEWLAPWDRMKAGHWCPKCDDLRCQTITITNVKKFAFEHGGICLSDVFVNSKTKLQWRCNKGHELWANWNTIQQGRWCPKCGKFRTAHAARNRVGIQKCKELAKTKGGECLSDVYIDALTKLKWRCEKGHEWQTSWNTVSADHWCPTCGKKRAKQAKTN